MADFGIDITSQTSKSVFLDQAFDLVITVCDQAADTCPVFPGPAERLDWSLRDPTAIQGSEHERLDAFRRVRDQMATRIGQFVVEESTAL